MGGGGAGAPGAGTLLATTRSPDEVDLLRRYGADAVVVTSRQDLTRSVLEGRRARPAGDRQRAHLDSAAEAAARLRSHRAHGKVVLTVP
ncbi:hypothetical protein PUR28_26860 [Streptomyces sp. BE308]|uniref:hypothetical protein n=1 Tax=Streptomyces sp. BE308 TaxID=3002529 RepID=UPI002E79DA55|nr:hypothetical protein [Streptomyces sp. BE308]MEE1794351.1 hypothetical protein [Streptomyces sp. BE308]